MIENNMYPVFVPIAVEPAKCPYCKAPEDKVEICRTCKHEYEEEALTLTDWLIGIPLLIIFLGIFLGVMLALVRFFFGPIIEFVLFSNF